MNLHILNGDSTAHIFKHASIPGEVAIWREALSEGRIIHPISDALFWADRAQEISRLYGQPQSDYTKKMMSQLDIIQSQHYDEITLWFEHDFYCQINMLACLAFLDSVIDLNKTIISIVCTGEEQRFNRAAFLGDYDAKEYPVLFDQRRFCTNSDLTHASQLFESLYGSDPNLFLSRCNSSETFPFLNQTRVAFISLFPQDEQSLSPLDALILSEAQKVETIQDLVRAILLRSPELGFGDAQVMNKIKSLHPFFDSFNPIKLSKNPEKQPDSDFIGAFDRRSYFFDQQRQKLV